jgi:putative DNA primase/helicase
VPDARLQGRTDIVVERLLSISGEDILTINRKNLPAVTVKLSTRVLLISNELPKLDDASGAIVSRIILLPLTESFYDKEDTELTDKLLAERSGILRWAVEGWQRLRQRRKFVQPDSGKDALRQMNDLASPIKTFVDECCNVGIFLNVRHDELYQAYRDWCDRVGRKYPEAPNTFGRNLRAAFPSIRDTQPVVNGERPRLYEGIDLKQK